MRLLVYGETIFVTGGQHLLDGGGACRMEE